MSEVLERPLSFKIYEDTGDDGVEGGEDRDEGSVEEGQGGSLVRTVTIGDAIKAVGSFDFSLSKSFMGLIVEEEESSEGEGEGNLRRFEALRGDDLGPPSPPMYLATGLGVDDGGSIVATFLKSEKVEEYYRNLVKEFPRHPLVLRNYAQLLQSKGDLHGAESYYLRSVLADPRDGETFSHYAKLVWELHHDQARALKYFACAVHASPDNSYVLGAYARFLWEIYDDGDDNSSGEGDLATEGPVDANIEEYYTRIVEESPFCALALRNYAQFLYQSKGDLHAAVEYYSRATLANPQDGEALSQLAKLVWELYHDKKKALDYFERSVKANPADSFILAAYAGFLWTIDDDDSEEEADPAS